MNALSSSKASFKIIVMGVQVLNSVAEKENYSNYPKEKEKLLKEILDNKIKGVLFLSGDRHFTEFSEVSRENAYSLFDWTVSPLTSGVAAEGALKENNIYRSKGSLITQHNFGMISFLGSKENRQIKLTVFDTAGTELWNKTILKKDLQ
ncbi:alkaline phosphatase D family protein [Flavobacterium sp. GSP27]|uniref:alkaline phosphatase D family protein n=1 Tax=Flavobacterium sp. GSP27 TaxID=2497489 RepID=UPI001F28A68E|nr:alkaline phosphatase D family protein [Flavobacterium sp. GSP27]